MIATRMMSSPVTSSFEIAAGKMQNDAVGLFLNDVAGCSTPQEAHPPIASDGDEEREMNESATLTVV